MGNRLTSKNSETIITNLKIIIKSGRYTLGYKSTLKTLQEGACKLVIIAENCPPTRRLEIEYYAMLNKSLIHHFHGNNTDLGIACGKLFKCSCLGVIDPGDTDLTALLL